MGRSPQERLAVKPTDNAVLAARRDEAQQVLQSKGCSPGDIDRYVDVRDKLSEVPRRVLEAAYRDLYDVALKST